MKNKLVKELNGLLDKFDRDNFSTGYLEVDKLIFSYREYFSQDEISKQLNELYQNLEDEIKEELIGDFLDRLHGFCSPHRTIKW